MLFSFLLISRIKLIHYNNMFLELLHFLKSFQTKPTLGIALFNKLVSLIFNQINKSCFFAYFRIKILNFENKNDVESQLF